MTFFVDSYAFLFFPRIFWLTIKLLLPFLRLLYLTVFSAAFGFLEAVVIVYLQQILGLIGSPGVSSITPGNTFLDLKFITFLKPQATALLIPFPLLLDVEVFRELAFFLMFLSLAFLIGKTRGEILAFFLFSFAVWNLFYYLSLRFIVSWPTSLLDRDIFFLIPVVWAGPVITPIVTSLLIIVLTLVYFVRHSLSENK